MSMEERKKAPPFPARGSHMTGLSICQTRVKYSLERRSPPTRLTGAGEAPWGTLSRGEAHLGALMRSALGIMLRWIFRRPQTTTTTCFWYVSTQAHVFTAPLLQTFNIESEVTWLNIFFFIKIFVFTGRALKNRPPTGTFHNFSLRDPRQLLTFYRHLKYSFVLFLLQIIVMAWTKLVISPLRVREAVIFIKASGHYISLFYVSQNMIT